MSKPLIEKLQKAKAAHLTWRENAEVLVSITQDDISQVIKQLPVKHTDCEFAQWFYGEGQRFSHLPLYQDIGLIHVGLHQEFELIYNLIMSEKNKRKARRLLPRIFMKKQPKRSLRVQAKAVEHLIHLQMISKKLVNKIDKLEQYLIEHKVA